MCHTQQKYPGNLHHMHYTIGGFDSKLDKGGTLVHLDQAETFNRVDNHYQMSVLI